MTDQIDTKAARPWSAWAGLFALVAMWGSAFSVMHVAVAEIAPQWVAAGRLWVGFAFAGLCLLLTRQSLPNPAQAPAAWRAYVLVGVFGTALPFSLFAWGAAHAPSALMGISNGATPVFTALLATLFIASDQMDGRRWFGVALGFLGIVALVGPQAFDALANTDARTHLQLLGLLAGVAGAFCYAGANIVTKRAPALAAIPAAMIFTGTGALACTVLALASRAPLPVTPSLQAMLCVLALGIFPTGFASVLYVWIVRTHGAVFASLGTYLSPVFAALIGVVVLHERVGLAGGLALALIVSGVVVAAQTRR